VSNIPLVAFRCDALRINLIFGSTEVAKDAKDPTNTSMKGVLLKIGTVKAGKSTRSEGK
jgi:hypothetical protein